MKKQEVLEMVSRFPEDFSAEELMYRLYLKTKLDQAEAAVESGDVLTHEEIVQRTQLWFDS